MGPVRSLFALRFRSGTQWVRTLFSGGNYGEIYFSTRSGDFKL